MSKSKTRVVFNVLVNEPIYCVRSGKVVGWTGWRLDKVETTEGAAWTMAKREKVSNPRNLYTVERLVF